MEVEVAVEVVVEVADAARLGKYLTLYGRPTKGRP